MNFGQIWVLSLRLVIKVKPEVFFYFFWTFTTALTKSATKALHTLLGGIMKGLKFAVVKFHYEFWHIGYLRSEFYYAQKPSFNFQTLVKVVANFANTKAVSGQCDWNTLGLFVTCKHIFFSVWLFDRNRSLNDARKY